MPAAFPLRNGKSSMAFNTDRGKRRCFHTPVPAPGSEILTGGCRQTPIAFDIKTRQLQCPKVSPDSERIRRPVNLTVNGSCRRLVMWHWHEYCSKHLWKHSFQVCRGCRKAATIFISAEGRKTISKILPKMARLIGQRCIFVSMSIKSC